ncbi:MAG: HIT domain-containing protein [Alphaproteobacteria bacterium]|nr:HIT domain-containing protein [Alphaproteobacteria bacterium]
MTDLRECIFCRIVAGTSPCQEIFRDAATLAFMDIHPANDGHCLVIPRRHYENVFDMPPDEFGQVGLAVAKVVRAVKEVLQPGGSIFYRPMENWPGGRFSTSTSCPAAPCRRQPANQLGPEPARQ